MGLPEGSSKTSSKGSGSGNRKSSGSNSSAGPSASSPSRPSTSRQTLGGALGCVFFGKDSNPPAKSDEEFKPSKVKAKKERKSELGGSKVRRGWGY
jgi:hypothetical protein